jgi:hypothetical protein
LSIGSLHIQNNVLSNQTIKKNCCDEKRFKAKWIIPELFNEKMLIVNGFDFPLTPVIIDTNPELILHYNYLIQLK